MKKHYLLTSIIIAISITSCGGGGSSGGGSSGGNGNFPKGYCVNSYPTSLTNPSLTTNPNGSSNLYNYDGNSGAGIVDIYYTEMSPTQVIHFDMPSPSLNATLPTGYCAASGDTKDIDSNFYNTNMYFNNCKATTTSTESGTLMTFSANYGIYAKGVVPNSSATPIQSGTYQFSCILK